MEFIKKFHESDLWADSKKEKNTGPFYALLEKSYINHVDLVLLEATFWLLVVLSLWRTVFAIEFFLFSEEKFVV